MKLKLILGLLAALLVPDLAAQTTIKISPDFSQATNNPITLTVTGGGFVSGTVVSFNDNALQTTFVNSHEVTAIIPCCFAATTSTSRITATNPGDAPSRFEIFRVFVYAPIGSYTPTHFTAGVGAALTVRGEALA